METKQITNITITDQKVAAQYLAFLREQKECEDGKILRKLNEVSRKLDGLGAIVIQVAALEEKVDALIKAIAEAKVSQAQLDQLHAMISGNKEKLEDALESPIA